ncbi:hypothetical protein AMJ74_01955 [candidate division WOR_3 bacterium SM1_77]|uniref:Glycerophosphoryl diester phosphodiesterase membrane domain-containing protein n=1 Tax=candidate division WOR_3 bacterium SM1_77 TaxID=1703778 RepID=A0A0S8K203_UNCW3|nr:MAG: hypothetical protein AMJ74_01955 [candidate division WOR_3 bacterium SM1_77]
MAENIARREFDIEEAIKFGWNTMKANFWFFFGIIWTAVAISIVPNLPVLIVMRASRFTGEHAFIIAILYIVSIVAGSIIQMGYINIGLIFCDEKKAKFSDYFAPLPHILTYIVSSILYGLIVMGGFLLFIIPGIYWAVKFQFFGYFIIDQKCGPIDALKKSSAITEDVKWQLILFGIVLYLINLLGVIALFVGLFAAGPTTLVAYTSVYRKLLNQTKAVTA